MSTPSRTPHAHLPWTPSSRATESTKGTGRHSRREVHDVSNLKTRRQKVRRRHARFGALLTLIIAIGTAGCGSSTGSTSSGNQLMKPFKISVTQANDLYGLPWHIGVHQGIFKRHGLVITDILAGNGGSATLRQLLSGKLPFGEVSFGAVVDGYNAGSPLKVIGGGTQGIDDLVYVTNPGQDIGSISDMKGKRWGYTNPGSGTDVQAYLLPTLAGMDPNSFKHVATGGTGEGVALLQSHSVDMVYMPLNLYYQNSSAYKVVFYPVKYAPKFQVSTIVGNPRVLQQHPKAARALMVSYAESVKWIKKHPKATAEYWSSYNDMDTKIAAKVLARAIKYDHWGTGFNEKALSTAAKGISLIKGGPKKVPWCGLFTTKYLPKDTAGAFPKEESCKK